MDVVSVKDNDGNIFCTDFYIKFHKQVNKEGIKDTSIDTEASIDYTIPSEVDLDAVARAISSTEGGGFQPQAMHLVTISCNNQICQDIVAFIIPTGHVYFYDEELNLVMKTPSTKKLQSLNLKPGPNVIICIHGASNTSVSFTMWLFGLHENLVIMDIDGTITKSDVTGYIQTVYMGRFNYIHEGVVPFLNILTETYKYRIIYLTSRPFIHQKETRSFLEGIRDENGLKMPSGPLFPSKDHWMAALYREIITKTTLQLKASALSEISRVFSHAGNRRISPFVLGIGNKENDALAYNLVGMNADKILIIDTSSNITVWKYASYNQQSSVTRNSGSSSTSTSRSTSTNSTNSKLLKNINTVFLNPLFRNWTSSINQNETSRESINPKKRTSLLKSDDYGPTTDDLPITIQPTDEIDGAMNGSNSSLNLPAVGGYTSDHAIIHDHFAVNNSLSRLSLERAQSDPLSPTDHLSSENKKKMEHNSKINSGFSNEDLLPARVIDFSFDGNDARYKSYQSTNDLRSAGSSSSSSSIHHKGMIQDDQRYYLNNRPNVLKRSTSERQDSTASTSSYMSDMFSRTIGNRYGVDVGSAAKANDTTSPKYVFHTYKDLDLIKYIDKLSGMNLY